MCSGYTLCAAVKNDRGGFKSTKKHRYSFEQDHASMIKNHVRRKSNFPIPTHLIKTYFEFKKNVLITCSISNPPADD